MLKKRLPTNSTTKTVFQKISSKSALQNFRAGWNLPPQLLKMVLHFMLHAMCHLLDPCIDIFKFSVNCPRKAVNRIDALEYVLILRLSEPVLERMLSVFHEYVFPPQLP